MRLRQMAAWRRTKVRAARATWMPLALRWRRRRQQRPAAGSRVRATSPAAASVTWLAQLHLHFSAMAMRESLRSTVTRESKTIRTMWRTGNPACPGGRDRRDTDRQDCLSSTTRVFRTITAAATTKILLLNAPHAAKSREAATFLHHTDRRTRSLVESILRIASSKNEHTHAIERHATLLSRESRLFRSSSSSTHAHSHRESTAVSQRCSRQASELVWRSAPRPQIESNDGPPAPAVFPRRVTVPNAPPEPPRDAARTALKAADFDPGLLDRLTDDVIRRVERRARIERERRGL